MTTTCPVAPSWAWLFKARLGATASASRASLGLPLPQQLSPAPILVRGGADDRSKERVEHKPESTEGHRWTA